MRFSVLLGAVLGAFLLSISGSNASAANVLKRPAPVTRSAIHPGLLREFALTALQHLKGPAQRPFLQLLKTLPPAKQVGVTISTKATKNMQCSEGTCTPTAAVAVLNVGQLTNMLVDQTVTISTSAQAPDIFVNAPFSWTSANGLTLQAIGSIVVNKPLSDSGPAPLSLIYDANGSGGTLYFGAKGHISFLSTGNPLTINGKGYILANNIQLLAQLIARNPSGNFALAANYNAKHDGKYTQSPIQTPFQGNLEGLGNFITGLHIESTMPGQPIGLLQQIMPNAILENFRMRSVVIDGDSFLGGLAADNQGTLYNNSVDGQFTVAGDTGKDCDYSYAGELVGINEGTILSSSSSGRITGTQGCFVIGGLAGVNGNSFPGYIGTSYSTSEVSGTSDHDVDLAGLVGATGFGGTDSLIVTSYATGNISLSGTGLADIGGLVAFVLQGLVSQSSASGAVSVAPTISEAQAGGFTGGITGNIDRGTATGAVSAGQNCYCGGFVGNAAPVVISNSDSYGSVIAGPNSYLGGFVGYDHVAGDMSNDGWCTTSSGITDPSQGAGNIPNDPGIAPFTC